MIGDKKRLAKKVNEVIDNSQPLVSNPLHKIRNSQCPCGSGLKCKRCCGKLDAVPLKLGERLMEIVRQEKSKR